MTKAQAKGHAAAAKKRAAAARKRAQALEKKELAEIASVWEHIPEDSRRPLAYIAKEIASGRRDDADVKALRETRAIWFRPWRKYLPKED